MIKPKDKINITKVLIKTCLITLFLFFMVTSSYGNEVMTLNVRSNIYENFLAKVLVDTKGIKGANLLIARKKDYKERDLKIPLFLNSLFIEMTNIYEGDLRVVYVRSRHKINDKRFDLLLKLDLGAEIYLKGFDVRMVKVIKNDIVKEDGINFSFAYSPFYRSSVRDLNVGSTKVNSTTTLVINHFSLDIEKKYGMFFDIGYGIFRISDDILFSGLTVPVIIDNFDSGRTLAYGGGAHLEFFKTDNFVFDFMFNITRFKGESKNEILKVFSSTSKVIWNELNASISSKYNLHKYFSPLFFVSYSKITGDFKVEQSLLFVPSSDSKTIDEDVFYGLGLGFTSKLSKKLAINFLTEFVNQISFKLALSYVF